MAAGERLPEKERGDALDSWKTLARAFLPRRVISELSLVTFQ